MVKGLVIRSLPIRRVRAGLMGFLVRPKSVPTLGTLVVTMQQLVARLRSGPLFDLVPVVISRT